MSRHLYIFVKWPNIILKSMWFRMCLLSAHNITRYYYICVRWLFYLSLSLLCVCACVFCVCLFVWHCNSCHIIIPKKWIYWNLFCFVLNVHPSGFAFGLCVCVFYYSCSHVIYKYFHSLHSSSAIVSHANILYLEYNYSRYVSVVLKFRTAADATVWHVRIKSVATTAATVVVAIWSGLHANC